MIEKLIGEAMKILSMKYNLKTFCFEVECVMPGHKVASIYQFGKQYFPNHSPIPLLDEKVQVGEAVHVWIKEEELLKSQGWKEIVKGTLGSPDSPWRIGKSKKVYLGGAHKGTVCLNEKFQPFVLIKGYRFSEKEIKCIIRLDDLFAGKTAKIEVKDGEWTYQADKGIITNKDGINILNKEEINNVVDLLRRARLI